MDLDLYGRLFCEDKERCYWESSIARYSKDSAALEWHVSDLWVAGVSRRIHQFTVALYKKENLWSPQRDRDISSTHTCINTMPSGSVPIPKVNGEKLKRLKLTSPSKQTCALDIFHEFVSGILPFLLQLFHSAFVEGVLPAMSSMSKARSCFAFILEARIWSGQYQ